MTPSVTSVESSEQFWRKIRQIGGICEPWLLYFSSLRDRRKNGEGKGGKRERGFEREGKGPFVSACYTDHTFKVCCKRCNIPPPFPQ